MGKSTDIRVGQLHLDKSRINELDRQIDNLFRNKKTFLQPNYTLTRLAKDINAPLHHISAFLNHYYGIHFNEFINKYRISYCIATITEEELKHKKIETIAKESGFSNRNTFRIAFKKVTGMTPSKYLKDKTTDGSQTTKYDREAGKG